MDGNPVTNKVDNFYGIYLPSNVSWSLSGNANGVLTASLTTAPQLTSRAALPSLPQRPDPKVFYLEGLPTMSNRYTRL